MSPLRLTSRADAGCIHAVPSPRRSAPRSNRNGRRSDPTIGPHATSTDGHVGKARNGAPAMIPVLSRDECLEAFRKMLLIRRFEEACIVAAHKGQVPGHFHVYIGQEATGVGAMSVLDRGDFVHSTHRNHGHLLARGADPKKALAEILGKATGYAGGKAGTLHGCAPDLNFPLSSGIVAGILPISTGTAYAFKHRRQPNVSAVFFGEGAMEEGA